MNAIKKLREEMGIDQAYLARKISVSQPTVSDWENNRKTPSNKSAVKLAEFFGVSVDYILGREEPKNKRARPKGVRIPVLGQVPAGIPIQAITEFDAEDPDDWEEITEEMAVGGTYFALRIKGDSMTPAICDGDIVIVRQQEDVNSGEVAIVIVNGDDATCKRVVKQTQGISLVANNPAYEPRFFTNKEIIEIPVRVIGKVVELRRSF